MSLSIPKQIGTLHIFKPQFLCVFSENPFFVAGAALLLYNGSDGRPMPFARPRQSATPGKGIVRHPLTYLLEAADDIAYSTAVICLKEPITPSPLTF